MIKEMMKERKANNNFKDNKFNKHMKFTKRSLCAIYVLSFLVLSLSFLITFNVFIKYENNKAYADDVYTALNEPFANSPGIYYDDNYTRSIGVIHGSGVLSEDDFEDWPNVINDLYIKGDSTTDRIIINELYDGYEDEYARHVHFENVTFNVTNVLDIYNLFTSSILESMDFTNCTVTNNVITSGSFTCPDYFSELDLSGLTLGGTFNLPTSNYLSCYLRTIILPDEVTTTGNMVLKPYAGFNYYKADSDGNILGFSSDTGLDDDYKVTTLGAKDEANGVYKYVLSSKDPVGNFNGKNYYVHEAEKFWDISGDYNNATHFAFLFPDGTLMFKEYDSSKYAKSFRVSVSSYDNYKHIATTMGSLCSNEYNCENRKKMFRTFNMYQEDDEEFYFDSSDLTDSYMPTPWSLYEAGSGTKIKNVVIDDINGFHANYFANYFANLENLEYVDIKNVTFARVYNERDDFLFYNSGTTDADTTIKVDYIDDNSYALFRNVNNLILDLSGVSELPIWTKGDRDVTMLDINPYSTKKIYTPINVEKGLNYNYYSKLLRSFSSFSDFGVMIGYSYGSDGVESDDDEVVGYFGYIPSQAEGVDYLVRVDDAHLNAINNIYYLMDYLQDYKKLDEDDDKFYYDNFYSLTPDLISDDRIADLMLESIIANYYDENHNPILLSYNGKTNAKVSEWQNKLVNDRDNYYSSDLCRQYFNTVNLYDENLSGSSFSFIFLLSNVIMQTMEDEGDFSKPIEKQIESTINIFNQIMYEITNAKIVAQDADYYYLDNANFTITGVTNEVLRKALTIEILNHANAYSRIKSLKDVYNNYPYEETYSYWSVNDTDDYYSVSCIFSNDTESPYYFNEWDNESFITLCYDKTYTNKASIDYIVEVEEIKAPSSFDNPWFDINFYNSREGVGDKQLELINADLLEIHNAPGKKKTYNLSYDFDIFTDHLYHFNHQIDLCVQLDGEYKITFKFPHQVTSDFVDNPKISYNDAEFYGLKTDEMIEVFDKMVGEGTITIDEFINEVAGRFIETENYDVIEFSNDKKILCDYNKVMLGLPIYSDMDAYVDFYYAGKPIVPIPINLLSGTVAGDFETICELNDYINYLLLKLKKETNANKITTPLEINNDNDVETKLNKISLLIPEGYYDDDYDVTVSQVFMLSYEDLKKYCDVLGKYVREPVTYEDEFEELISQLGDGYPEKITDSYGYLAIPRNANGRYEVDAIGGTSFSINLTGGAGNYNVLLTPLGVFPEYSKVTPKIDNFKVKVLDLESSNSRLKVKVLNTKVLKDGKAVLDPEDIQVIYTNNVGEEFLLDYSDDFVIDEDGYKDNDKAGYGQFRIKGRNQRLNGEYEGYFPIKENEEDEDLEPKDEPVNPPKKDPEPTPTPDKPSIVATTITIGGMPSDSANGYINGYSDKTIKPNNGITRAEFIKIMAETAPNFSIDDKTNINAISEYKDVNKNSWYAPYAGYLLKCKVINGYNDKTLKPNEKITRAEACEIISNMYDPKAINNTNELNKFNKELDNRWYEECVTKLVNAGIIAGYKDGTFKPNNKITRAETVTLINRTLGIKNTLSDYQKQYVLNNYKDIKEKDWFFNDIAIAIFNK